MMKVSSINEDENIGKNKRGNLGSQHGSDNDAKSGKSRNSGIENGIVDRLFLQQEAKVRSIEAEFNQMIELIG
jgi:hypothetical protein